jgi:hypothetical protein
MRLAARQTDVSRVEILRAWDDDNVIYAQPIDLRTTVQVSPPQRSVVPARAVVLPGDRPEVFITLDYMRNCFDPV